MARRMSSAPPQKDQPNGGDEASSGPVVSAPAAERFTRR
jgi:hypothetical protein